MIHEISSQTLYYLVMGYRDVCICIHYICFIIDLYLILFILSKMLIASNHILNRYSRNFITT